MEFWNKTIPRENLYTIIFNMNAQIVHSNILEEYDCDGGTNISAPFVLYENYI